MNILKLLYSQQNKFKLSDLFNVSADDSTEYEFKGMTCFMAAHYLSFFRQLTSDLFFDQ